MSRFDGGDGAGALTGVVAFLTVLDGEIDI